MSGLCSECSESFGHSQLTESVEGASDSEDNGLLPPASTTPSITAGVCSLEVGRSWKLTGTDPQFVDGAILAHFCLSLRGTYVMAPIDCTTITVCEMKSHSNLS